MWCFLTQLVLAAGEEDIDKWANILFVVVVGIFWVVGGILKAKANKAASSKGQSPKGQAPKGQEQQELRERRLKALWEAIGFEEPVSEEGGRPSSPVQRQKMVRPQPAGREPAPKKEEAISIPILAPLEGAGPVEDIPQTEYLGEVLQDYDDPEALRRAILHYEILGKPMSLRRPTGVII